MGSKICLRFVCVVSSISCLIIDLWLVGSGDDAGASYFVGTSCLSYLPF